ERQLICTAEAAWDLAVGPSALAVGERFRSPVAPEVVLGTVSEVEPPRALALTTAPGRPGDAVRLTLGEGTGHGARLMLEVSGTDPDERDDAVPAWGADVLARIVREVARLAGVRCPPPSGAAVLLCRCARAGGGLRIDRQAVRCAPPSTSTIVPVMLGLVASSTIACATSSAVAILRVGRPAATESNRARRSASGSMFHHGVST